MKAIFTCKCDKIRSTTVAIFANEIYHDNDKDHNNYSNKFMPVTISNGFNDDYVEFHDQDIDYYHGFLI